MFLGIDWGGTYIKAGLVNSQGKILKKEVFSSQSFKRRKVLLDTIESLVNKLERRRIQAIGIGVPGIIASESGWIYYLPNISGWRNFPLKGVLEKRLRLPVFVDNDANTFALAEAHFGAAKNAKHAIFLTLGTGLGGAVLIDGKVLEGRTSASELGHVPVSLEKRKCACGGNGCIETFVGSHRLLEKYNKLRGQKPEIKDVKQIYQKALQGEKEALIVWREFSYALGVFLSGMVNVFNPERIVLGGGVAGAFKLFKPLLWKVIKTQSMWPQIKGLKIVKAKLEYAGIIGAALLAKQSLVKAKQSKAD